jgi:hypothetical protein
MIILFDPIFDRIYRYHYLILYLKLKNLTMAVIQFNILKCTNCMNTITICITNEVDFI